MGVFYEQKFFYFEIKEKKDRVEDALFATKAALEDGVVPGGGTMLFHCAPEIKNRNSQSETIATEILSKAMKAPFKKILSNAGIEDWFNKIPESGKVYDAKNLVSVDAFESGIIDPAKVVITALTNAVSVAGTILTTESVVFEQKEKEENQSQQGMGMM